MYFLGMGMHLEKLKKVPRYFLGESIPVKSVWPKEAGSIGIEIYLLPI